MISWPGLFAVCMVITAYGAAHEAILLYFNLAYVFMILSLLWLERVMPHEPVWLEPDGQNFASIMHTLSSKGTIQLLVLYGGSIGLAEMIKPMGHAETGFWPTNWPLWGQVVLGVVVAEFGLYWAHRLGHQVPLFWRFHAVHHSVTKLWIVNTGRFHVLDSLFKIVLGMGVLLMLGAPLEVVQWLSAITAFIGLLTHCNVEMRFGPLDYIFNTPAVHRWHHSRLKHENQNNYGENLVIWDLLFGTYLKPSDRRPPADVGINEYMPPRFIDQVLWPFWSEKKRAEYRKAKARDDFSFFINDTAQ
jgi:sterol desaturase/sphingolipid hydroxylase (fatty acid hydroxylase superfamily)